MSGVLTVVAALALADLLLTLLVARRVRQLAARLPRRPATPWLAPGTQIPSFEAVTVAGDWVSLDRLRGKPSLVGIFSPGCEPCKEQVPVFARTAPASVGPGQALAVVVGPAEDAGELIASLDGLVPVAREGRRGPVAAAFAAQAFPSIYLLDADGRVVSRGPSVAAVTGQRPGAAGGFR